MHVHNFLFILHNQERKFILSLHYNESNSFLCVNVVKMYQLKAKDFEVKPYLLCLGNISKDFTTDKMKKTWLKGRRWTNSSADYNAVGTNKIYQKNIYWVAKHLYNKELCDCQVRPALLNLISDETHFYPFPINVNKCGGNSSNS